MRLMNIQTASVLATLGTTLCISRSLPQVAKSIKSGFAGLSLGTWIISLCEITTWAIWAIVTKQWIAGISSFLLWPISIFFIVNIAKTRRSLIATSGSLEEQLMSLSSSTTNENSEDQNLVKTTI